MGWAADDRSKLERDIVDFRQMRFDKFGVSKDRVDVAPGENFNMAIRELRGAEGGTSINPLADDDSYQDIHVSDSHKHGYGFDVPIANPEQANAVIKFFQDRGYSTYHGAQDPTGAHDHHVHVEAPNADVLKRPSEMVKPPTPAPSEPPVKPNVPEQQASLSTSPQSVNQVAQLPGSNNVQVLPTASEGGGPTRQTIPPPPQQVAKIENNIPTNLSPEDGDNPLILGTISQLNILS